LKSEASPPRDGADPRGGVDRDARVDCDPSIGRDIRVDLDALLVALVVVPNSYSRNRFFNLFRAAPAKRVRRRAARLRSLISELCRRDIDTFEVDTNARGGACLRYRLVGLDVRRTAKLSETELAIVVHAVERQAEACGALDDLFAAVGKDQRRRVLHTVAGLYRESPAH
jgi:hypothetical protein